MPLSHLIPRRVRGTDEDDSREPSWLNKKVTNLLLSASYHVCIHPIYTVVIVALLASTTYIGLLEGSLVDSIRDTVPGQIDIESLLQGGRHLRLGPATEWKWRAQESVKLLDTSAQHLALTTFIFPDSNSQPKHTAPSPNKIHFGENITLQSIPETPHLLSPISSESSLAFVVPYIQLPGFLKTAQEIPQSFDSEDSGEQKKWIMKAARSPTYGNRKAVRIWLSDAWTSFVDLIKHAETVDIIIMSLGYIAMHLTFVSLFISMRRLGSHFWLATTVLFTGGIAFLFGLLVTTKLGVPMSMVLLSEGLPFLVVTVGFEKAIILTEAVLSAFNRQHASDRPRTSDGKPMNPIQGAIQTAIKEKGFLIVRDYCIEIAIISVGGVSGVQGGLRQFCCLAAWILFFDAVLLFMFYTTILCIKLEISCIKRHVALRKALEEEGINYRVAEHVASSNDWPRTNDEASSEAKKDTIGIFDKAKASSVPRFKFFMVAGFIIVNIIHLLTIRFKKHEGLLSPLFLKFFSTSINPFKVAENGLDTIYVSAKSKQVETFVTVLPPIKYSLEYPSVHYANSHVFDIEYSDQILDVVGGKVFESLLKSLEDPVISKWIVAALMLSVGLNGYLFNAARWSLKEPDTVTTELPSKIEPAQEKEDEAVKFKRKEVAQSINLRSREECERLVKEKMAPYLQDEELIDLAVRGKIPGYALEKNMEQPEVDRVEAFTRAVKIRRAMIARNPLTSETTGSLENSKVPYMGYNYSLVHGACCENVIGYLPLPLGLAGPLNIDGKNYFIPMATTEGVLVASTSRGCKAINAGGGAVTVVIGDGMTRGPCVSFPTLSRAGAAKLWLDSEEGRTVMKNAFNSTSRFARLQQMKASLAGTYLYIRFKTTTGDAMGMNMISKGVERALHAMATEAGFEDMVTITVSGNFCVDKKPAAINWIDGRGKSVIAEATVPAAIVKSVLKTDVDSLVELNISKNLVGSAMAGSVGGFNAHASNIVTAVFLATGQDPAQNIESSNCITLMKNVNGNLHITVSMPSVEVGTIGGGTILEAQSGMLDLLGIRGAHPTNPGSNARQLARTVAAAVLAGELSLCSALAAGHLVRAHMAHNRSQVPSRAATPASMPPASPSSVPKELVNAQKNGVNGGSTVGISIAGAVDRLSLPSARR